MAYLSEVSILLKTPGNGTGFEGHCAGIAVALTASVRGFVSHLVKNDLRIDREVS